VTDDPERAVRQYLAKNPDAGVLDVISDFVVPPSERELVEAIVQEGAAAEPRNTPCTGAADEQPMDEARSEPPEHAPVEAGAWGEADFTAPQPGRWPAELLEREQWMGHADKRPFAPWADRNHPEADFDEDARWKWGLPENYADGETVAMAEVDPRLDGRVFLQQADDPYAFVDGDDVRCPETGEVHPAFVEVLQRLGVTYADISTSGAGVHANYRGELPADLKQATFAIDEDPWGANDELPEVEIYDGKHVCVATGEHVPGTPLEVHDWDTDALEEVLDEYGQLPEPAPSRPTGDLADERESFDASEYEADATTADETTDDIRDVFAALDRIDAQNAADRTIVHAWNDDASTSDDKRAFIPTWGTNANGTANVVDDEIWQDTGGGGYGGPVTMALIETGEVRPSRATPRVTGET